MAVGDERELRARVDAADANAPQCVNKHAIVGNNVYKDGTGRKRCWLCRIERHRSTPRARDMSKRKPHIPLTAETVRALRVAAGLTVVEGSSCLRN